jgi:hypothetical protein
VSLLSRWQRDGKTDRSITGFLTTVDAERVRNGHTKTQVI